MQMKNVVEAVKALILPLILVLLVNLTGCSEEKSDIVLDVQEAVNITEDLMMPVNYYKMPLEYYKVNAPTEGKSKVKLAIMTSDKESIEEIWTCDFDLKNSNGIFGLSYTHFSYIIPLFCFAYLAFYGFITPKILKKQGAA